MKRYRRWAGSPNGVGERFEYCQVSVADGGRSCLSHQCYNKRKTTRVLKQGEVHLCGVHARMVDRGGHIWVPEEGD